MKKCYNPEQEKFYPQAQENIFYSSSAFIDFDQGDLTEVYYKENIKKCLIILEYKKEIKDN